MSDPPREKPYSTKIWRDFRKGLLERFGEYCAKCGKTGPGVVLQIHHLKYRRGVKPWEYPLSDLEILCRGCHAEAHGRIMPRTGWELEAFNDTGEPSEECELCGTEIRYVYTISHPSWGLLDVGEQCCDKLTAEIDATGHLRLYKSALRRKETFLKSPLWRRVGSSLFRRYANFYCEIHPDEAGHRLKLTCEGLGEIPGRKLFASEDEAKALLFDLVESGELVALFVKRFGRSE